MYLSPEMIQYFQQLNSYLQYQNQQIHEMNRLIRQLVQELNHLNGKNGQPPVIKNEYKFDLLKVERLMGTLNIGIKPDGTGSSIEEFAVNPSLEGQTLEQEYPELYEGIQRRIGEYLSQDAYQAILTYEHKHGRPLDEVKTHPPPVMGKTAIRFMTPANRILADGMGEGGYRAIYHRQHQHQQQPGNGDLWRYAFHFPEVDEQIRFRTGRIQYRQRGNYH